MALTEECQWHLYPRVPMELRNYLSRQMGGKRRSHPIWPFDHNMKSLSNKLWEKIWTRYDPLIPDPYKVINIIEIVQSWVKGITENQEWDRELLKEQAHLYETSVRMLCTPLLCVCLCGMHLLPTIIHSCSCSHSLGELGASPHFHPPP
jgi:hypothetical protein